MGQRVFERSSSATSCHCAGRWIDGHPWFGKKNTWTYPLLKKNHCHVAVPLIRLGSWATVALLWLQSRYVLVVHYRPPTVYIKQQQQICDETDIISSAYFKRRPRDKLFFQGSSSVCELLWQSPVGSLYIDKKSTPTYPRNIWQLAPILSLCGLLACCWHCSPGDHHQEAFGKIQESRDQWPGS